MKDGYQPGENSQPALSRVPYGPMSGAGPERPGPQGRERDAMSESGRRLDATEVEELLGAYALDACDADETDAIELASE